MCFSATASFTAGAAITAVGAVTVKTAHNTAQRIFAGIPFLFAIQQFAEGFVWLALTTPDPFITQRASTYAFLFFSDIFWPIMIPLSVYLLEQDSGRKKILRIPLAMGIVLSLYYGCCLLLIPVSPVIVDCHIFYSGDFPKMFEIPAFLVYVTVTITPLLVSSVKRMRWLGLSMFLACVVTVIFYLQAVTSVWCFFAAVLSAMIYWILKANRPEVPVAPGASD